jgi:hypothetical protein
MLIGYRINPKYYCIQSRFYISLIGQVNCKCQMAFFYTLDIYLGANYTFNGKIKCPLDAYMYNGSISNSLDR